MIQQSLSDPAIGDFNACKQVLVFCLLDTISVVFIVKYSAIRIMRACCLYATSVIRQKTERRLKCSRHGLGFHGYSCCENVYLTGLGGKFVSGYSLGLYL